MHPAEPLSPSPAGPGAALAPPGDVSVLDDPLELDTFTRWSEAPSGARTGESVFAIEGMYCAACSITIEEALKRVPGVLAAEVLPASQRAQVRWDPQRTRASELAEAVAKAGYRAYPALSAQAESARRIEQRRSLWRLFVAGFCMMQVMMYAVPTYYATPGDMTDDIWRLLQWASWLLSIPVVVFAAGPFLKGAWAQLRARRIGMDVPVSLGIVVTFIASTGATFEPGGVFGREVYFDSLTMFVFFLLCGRHLELRARGRAAGALEGLMRRLPETVDRLRNDGAVESVSLQRLRPGDRVRVRAGQAFPADGTLLEGSAQVDEALLTGESRSVLREPGQQVVAGSFNLSAPVTMRVDTVGRDTRYARIVALMERASLDRPALARQADRIAGPFLWAVLIAAAGSALAWSFIEPSRSLWVAVAVLIVTCPCAISLATPSALLAATGALARRGILVQRLQALEALAQARLFVFDKTGTLTEDRLALTEVEPAAGWTREAVLSRAGSLAALSLHPVSRALSEAAAGLPAQQAAWTELREVPGTGIEGRDAEGRLWRLGRHEVSSGKERAPADAPQAWLRCGEEVVARFGFVESLRPDARSAIAALKAAGVGVRLLSGDRPEAAQQVARALGLDDVQAGASPEDKLASIARAQQAGTQVVMIGDGLNDGPVLAKADVSFAMGQGAPLTRAQADFTVLSGRLADVVEARELAVRTVRVIRQNLGWAALYNAVSIPLAVAGWMPPWLAGLGMAGSSLFVVLNATRLARPAPSERAAVLVAEATRAKPA